MDSLSLLSLSQDSKYSFSIRNSSRNMMFIATLEQDIPLNLHAGFIGLNFHLKSLLYFQSSWHSHFSWRLSGFSFTEFVLRKMPKSPMRIEQGEVQITY